MNNFKFLRGYPEEEHIFVSVEDFIAYQNVIQRYYRMRGRHYEWKISYNAVRNGQIQIS
jgi:hypothetical protein